MTCEHSPLTWAVFPDPDKKELEHVIPANDTRTHETAGCWCEPFEDGFAVVHNSADHREDYFEMGRKVS